MRNELEQESHDGRFSVQSYRTLLLGKPQHNMLIFVSPEYEPHLVWLAINNTNPSLVVFMLHKPQHLNSSLLSLLHKKVHFITQSPHVARFVKHHYGVTAHVVVVSRPFRPSLNESCLGHGLTGLRPGCLDGLAIQGRVESWRRNYKGIFEELVRMLYDPGEYKAAVARASIRIKIIGWYEPLGNKTAPCDADGHCQQDLRIPRSIRSAVQLFPNPAVHAFQLEVYRSYALLPALADTEYLVSRITSTARLSLVTGTPLIADDAFLASYTHFDESTTVRQGLGESLADVYDRIMRMSQEEYIMLRLRILRLAEDLNVRAYEWAQSLVDSIV